MCAMGLLVFAFYIYGFIKHFPAERLSTDTQNKLLSRFFLWTLLMVIGLTGAFWLSARYM